MGGGGRGDSMVWFSNDYDSNSDSIDVMIPVEGAVCIDMGSFRGTI